MWTLSTDARTYSTSASVQTTRGKPINYVLAGIVKDRVGEDGGREFLCRWRGYDDQTWENVSCFDEDDMVIVRAYLDSRSTTEGCNPLLSQPKQNKNHHDRSGAAVAAPQKTAVPAPDVVPVAPTVGHRTSEGDDRTVTAPHAAAEPRFEAGVSFHEAVQFCEKKLATAHHHTASSEDEAVDSHRLDVMAYLVAARELLPEVLRVWHGATGLPRAKCGTFPRPNTSWCRSVGVELPSFAPIRGRIARTRRDLAIRHRSGTAFTADRGLEQRSGFFPKYQAQGGPLFQGRIAQRSDS